MSLIAQLVTRGRSQFIVFPKELRFPGKTVRLQRSGKGVLMIPEKYSTNPRASRSGKRVHGN